MAACVIWGSQAEQQALHPPIRHLLEERLGGFSIAAIDTERHDTPVVIEGRLTSDAYLTDNGATLRLTVDRVWLSDCPEFTRGGVSLTIVGALAAQIRDRVAGRTDRARTPAALRRPARYLDHGVPDQERLLARRGIALVGTVKSAALVQVIETGSWLDEAASAIRARVRSAIQRQVGAHDAQSAAIAMAILIGDRGSLDPGGRTAAARSRHLPRHSDFRRQHRDSCRAHSWCAVAIRHSRWLGRGRGCEATLAAYAFMAGGGASVVRATVMAAIYLVLRVIDQRTSPLHAMSLTAIVILLASPLSIADVGLWLTFGATAAIIAGVTPRCPPAWWLRGPAVLLLASLSAEVVLMPIGALIFQRVTLAGLSAQPGCRAVYGRGADCGHGDHGRRRCYSIRSGWRASLAGSPTSACAAYLAARASSTGRRG